MRQLILCCALFGLVLTTVSALPPDDCPEDYDPIWRTDFRYRVSHDWVPYAKASSGDGIRWRVLVDQFDYQNIFGEFNFPPGKWKAIDADGDRITVSMQLVIRRGGGWGAVAPPPHLFRKVGVVSSSPTVTLQADIILLALP